MSVRLCATPIGVGGDVCSRCRWWRSLHSLTTGYRGYTPSGYRPSCRITVSADHHRPLLGAYRYTPTPTRGMCRHRHEGCTERRCYPEWGNISIAAGKRGDSRVPPVVVRRPQDTTPKRVVHRVRHARYTDSGMRVWGIAGYVQPLPGRWGCV